MPGLCRARLVDRAYVERLALGVADQPALRIDGLDRLGEQDAGAFRRAVESALAGVDPGR
jgi:hypothetical protein